MKNKKTILFSVYYIILYRTPYTVAVDDDYFEFIVVVIYECMPNPSVKQRKFEIMWGNNGSIQTDILILLYVGTSQPAIV